MTDNDSKGGKSGWSDRELLSTLINVIHKSNVTLNYKDAVYPPGRNANGFKQKINVLKNILKPEWDALEAGQPNSDGAGAVKKAANPRKRKTKSEDDSNGEAHVNIKKRGRPKKTVEPEEREETPIKEEVKDEDDESGLDD